MSNFSEVYDQLMEVVQAKLTEHKEMVNPYYPEDEANLDLKKAWGITVLDGDNDKKEMNTNLTVTRDFELLLSRKVFNLVGNTPESVAARKKAEKDLFEDQILLQKFFQSNTYLKTGKHRSISKIYLEGDGGLLFLRKNDKGGLLLRSIIKVDYFEPLGET